MSLVRSTPGGPEMIPKNITKHHDIQCAAVLQVRRRESFMCLPLRHILNCTYHRLASPGGPVTQPWCGPQIMSHLLLISPSSYLSTVLTNSFFFFLLLQASDQARSQALEQHGCHVSHVTAQLRCRSIRLPMRPHRSNQRHGSAPERSGGAYHRLLYL